LSGGDDDQDNGGLLDSSAHCSSSIDASTRRVESFDE
jgi:hypothetical protein